MREQALTFLREVALSASVTLVALLFVAGCSRDASQRSQTLIFGAGRFEIVADLQMPEGPGPHPAIIILHGGGGGTRGHYRHMRKRFGEAGYATLIWDKPGFGASKGQLSEQNTIAERADILLTATGILCEQPRVDGGHVGVWGVSQAGYMVASALQQDHRIAFAILVGPPGENSIAQTAYFVGQQVACAGASSRQWVEAETLAAAVLAAGLYDDYVTSGRMLLDRYPVVKEVGFMAGILPRDRWQPRMPDSESYFDPIPSISKTSIPVLVLYGELDKNVDPVQGSMAYQRAIESSGNRQSRVVLVDGVDHDMVPSSTGCESERRHRRSWAVSPGYLDTMLCWLSGIEQRPEPVNRRQK
jgi:pimeloyl-ACP methyl ester carboxylesterase